MWKDGAAGQEYFLVENRQRTGFDANIPGGGLLIWHIDDSIGANSDENHPKVALEQADGANHLGAGANRGDGGDVYPGSSTNTLFDKNSTPNSRSYAGSDTCVAVTSISASAAVMSAEFRVRCSKSLLKDFRDKGRDKRIAADKRPDKIFIENKRLIVDKSTGIDKRPDKSLIGDKRPEKPEIDKSVNLDKNFDKLTDFRRTEGAYPGLEERLAALEEAVSAIVPFIDQSLRPDLEMSALYGEDDLSQLQQEAERNQAYSKRLQDSPSRG
jgi:immune inhibitor A